MKNKVPRKLKKELRKVECIEQSAAYVVPPVWRVKPKVKIKQVPTTCHTGKLSYPTAEDAERATKLLKKKHKGGTKWYKCDYCGQYHLTSIKKRRKGKMRF